MAERPLCMRKAQGSNPCSSSLTYAVGTEFPELTRLPLRRKRRTRPRARARSSAEPAEMHDKLPTGFHGLVSLSNIGELTTYEEFKSRCCFAAIVGCLTRRWRPDAVRESLAPSLAPRRWRDGSRDGRRDSSARGHAPSTRRAERIKTRNIIGRPQARHRHASAPSPTGAPSRPRRARRASRRRSASGAATQPPNRARRTSCGSAGSGLP